MSKNYMENETYFSGSDAKVYVYRDVASAAQYNEAERRYKAGEEYRIAQNAKEEAQSLRGLGNGVSGSGGPGQFRGENPSVMSNVASGNSSQLTDQITRRNIQNIDPLRQSNHNSGTDREDSQIYELGTLSGIRYSTFRDKIAVRTLGRVHPKSYTRGQRTCAGTFIFNVVQEHEFLRFANGEAGWKEQEIQNKAVMLDQIDPFNVMIVFTNEFGGASVLHMFGVEIASESQQMTVSDLTIQNTMQFYAQDMLPMESIGNAFSSIEEMHAELIGPRNPYSLTGEHVIRNYLKNRIDNLHSPTGQDHSTNRINEMLQRSRGLF